MLEVHENDHCGSDVSTHLKVMLTDNLQQIHEESETKNEHCDGYGLFDQKSGHMVRNKVTTQQVDDSGNSMNLCEVMLKQNDITEMLVKQQRLSNLPQRDISVFGGDVLEFKSFMRAFEYTVHDKTDSYSDRLYYLEQFTRGEPRELVRSCQHMNPKQGYEEARRLLLYQYGDELKIANAYMSKVHCWPQIKSEDAKSLHSYSLFLTGINNAMQDINHLTEIETVANMRVVVSKLPYKLREKWRSYAFDIQETIGKRARFADLVRFINKQAKLAIDPVFGDLNETEEKGKFQPKVKTINTFKSKRSTFATSVSPVMNEQMHENSQSISLHASNAFQKPCIYCEKNHTLAECCKIRQQPHGERIKFLKRKGLCFGCLTQGHLSKDCKKRASCEHCSKKHPSLLHFTKDEGAEHADSSHKDVKVSPSDDPVVVASGTCGATGAGRDSCVLAIVPVCVKMKDSNRVIETYAFMDNGSQATFCSEKLMRQLNIEGRKTQILLRTMGHEKLEPSYLLSGLEVCGINENTYIDLPDVYTHMDIPVSKENIPMQQDLEKWSHLSGIELSHIEADVGLLIGNNAYKAMEPWEVVHSVNGGPYAVRTVLGWVINGPLKKISDAGSIAKHIGVSVNRISIANVENMLLQQFNNDFPERACEEKQEMSREDIQFINSVSETVTMIDGHYSIGLPLRDKHVKLPNNRNLAVQRAKNLKKKFIKAKEFHKEYQSFMSDSLNKGYAVKVDKEQPEPENGRVWYIPHHGVYHPRRGKLRVVFDCAASYQGKSLNGELLQGPNLTNSLIGVLTRFRHHSIALMSDIEAMYYQVKVPPEDTDLLRFLWWPNGDVNEPLQEYKMVVHLFGATSAPSCAIYALRKTAEDAKDVMAPSVVNAVLNHFYVDDCLMSVSEEKEACAMVKDLTTLCGKGGFHLSKWMSNSRAVLASIPETERAKEVKDLDLTHDSLPEERVLGVSWCVESDSFKVTITSKDTLPTRRSILSSVSSTYDPLGFLSPVILPAKMILQELCGKRFSWDENIPSETAHKAILWFSDLAKLHGFKVKRCLKPDWFGNITSAQLHHFADASEKGYGVVTYLRIMNENNQVHCSFILGKSRVSPLKQVTIPRLELTAAAVAVKIDKFMRKELQIHLDDSLFWSDSTTVLKYIASESARFKTFVANRVSLIRDNTKPNQWMYVNSELNPADHASRGMNADSFIKCKDWIHGPAFLWKEKEHWPISPDVSNEILKEDVEVREVTVNVTEVDENQINKLICHYSDWHHLKKAVSWMLRLKHLLQKLSKQRKCLSSQTTEFESPKHKADFVAKQMCKFKSTLKGTLLTAADVAMGEMEIVKFCQKQSFKNEITALQKGDKLERNSHIIKLDPVLQDGVLRVGGRLGQSSLPIEAKHPIILPKDHHVSALIIRHIHKVTGHSGTNYILSNLRERFWIPKANSAIRKVLSKCVTCRRLAAKPGKQKMANLPSDRLTGDKPPFTNVGIDYFGPFEVKVGRSLVKRYGVLFTCLTTRAIHLEVAHSLETDSCINAFRRFISRRGQVSVMRSDNGTNLVGAEKEMREAIKGWNQVKMSEALLQKNVTWIFNPPAGSHFGGIWERQIRSVRRILNQVLKQQIIDDERLHTLFCEVEAIVNNRPLTKMSSDPNDLEAITPNHLLLLKGQPGLPPGLFQKEDLYSKRRWRQVQYLSDIFWKRWTKEYLPLLQERQKWTQTQRNLQLGDVVLIIDDSAPRGSWLMGKVEKTICDSQGYVRRVFVRTKTNVLERPIDKLCLLLEMDE